MDKRGKIKLLITVSLFVVFGMFLFLSALDDTNIKEYDPVSQKVTIKSSSGEILSDITLNTPANFMVPRGYQKVAEFTIDNKKSSQTISSVLEKLEFYDLNNGIQKIVRQFDYKYEKSLGLKTINDYEMVCSDNDLGNGTIVKDCSQVLIGTHQEEIFEWADLSSLGEIPSGKTKIGIFVNVEKGDKVEWIPTFLGVEVTEWATWTEALDIGLISYYKLDEGSGTIIDELNNNNATNDGATPNATGIINVAYDFEEGETDVIATNSHVGIFDDRERTINVWVKRETFDDADEPISFGGSGTGNSWSIRFGGDGTDLAIDYGNTNTASNTSVGDTNWHMITGIYTGTSGRGLIYLDGNIVGNESDGSITTGNTSLFIGNSSINNNADFDGIIDEIGVWNRTLSSSEISDLYNNGSGLVYGVPTQNYTIIFNLTNILSGQQISTSGPQHNFDISCNNGYNVIDVENPHTTNNTFSGNVECTFSDLIDANEISYFSETQSITADSNKTVQIQMSPSNGLTQEEHDWLEAIYLCVINGTGCA